MRLSRAVQKILSYYESDNPGTKSKLATLLTHGRTGNSGQMIILPVDQGFEHGPARSFAVNPAAYDPHYHYKLAVAANVSAYAAPLGMLEAGADTFAGQMPLILKMNSSNSLIPSTDQAVTASINDALRLGCVGIGFTIYPGSDSSLEMFEEIRDLILEAKACGLAVVIWSYARGHVSKPGETSVNVISYGAHMAALLGAHVIKVKLPTDYLEPDASQKVYQDHKVNISTLTDRVRHVVQCCFNGRRIVVFSGGETKTEQAVYQDAIAIRDGGGHGSIIGRNAFQRPYEESLAMFKKLGDIYLKRT